VLYFSSAVPAFIFPLTTKYQGNATIHSCKHKITITTGPYDMPDLYFFSSIFEESIPTQMELTRIII